MNNQLNGFTKIEFLVIIISIAYGFCIVELLTNWSRIIRKRLFYGETIVWSGVIFIGILVLWYNSWDHIFLVERNSATFIGTLIPPIGLFVMVSALFPDQHDHWDLKRAFDQNRKTFFLSYTLVNASIMTLSNLAGSPTIVLNYSRSFWIVACILMYFIDSKVLRYVMAAGLISWYAYLIIFTNF